MKTNKKGFTLIELLVVVAIIGILSSIVLASLNTARKKGRIAGAQADMFNVLASIAMCADDGVVTLGTPPSTQPYVVVPICAGSPSKWPDLPGDWLFDNSATCTAPYSNATDTFGYCAVGEAGSVKIACTSSGCVKTP
ncbi:MAG: prepilin-type N-terminal cleavage/methylation domain-containing protein [Candidatus Paceibacterota bacterium]|jgi:prepilin-type N-terminal cleavage/methylation domain-containing protein